MNRSSKAIPPEEFDELSRSAPAKKAAGAPAIYHSMQHAIGKAGLRRGLAALRQLNQKKGFDCPSCAWPDPDGERSSFEFCENGAKAVASETTRKQLGREFFAKHSVAELSEKSDYWLEQQGRLVEPMILRQGSSHYEPIAWEEAFEVVGKSLRELASPDQAIFYTSGRASNEAAFAYQLLARTLGTNNLPDCSNMCHESSGLALKQSIGVGKGTVTLQDLREAEVIVIAGQNPGTNHPRMLTTLQEAKERGAIVVSINPLQEAGLKAFAHPQRPSQIFGGKTSIADHFITIPINADQALFQATAKRLLELDRETGKVLDRDFISEHTEGFDAFSEALSKLSWEELILAGSLRREDIDLLAGLFSRSKKIISCWAMGLTQHRNAVATIRDLANLHLLRGAIGKKGAGLCPVRGHSNVQGDRTMGIWEQMPEWFLQKLDQEFDIKSPREHGLHALSAICDMKQHAGRVFVSLGGNFLSATPDTGYVAEALQNCSLTVQVSTKLNRSHLVCGKTALILPCLGRSEIDRQASGEQWISMENSMGIVHSSSGSLPPISSTLKSEIAIVCGIALKAVAQKGRIDWQAFTDDYRVLRESISRVVPGFENYNERARQPGGYYLPNAAKERRFETDTGKANFATNVLDIEKPDTDQLLLMTIRSHDQFNTTIYGLDDRYRGIRGERRVVFMNKSDMEERSIKTEETVDVESCYDGAVRLARKFKAIPYDIPERCIAMYFPEANVLVPVSRSAVGSETPISKSVQVIVRKR